MSENQDLLHDILNMGQKDVLLCRIMEALLLQGLSSIPDMSSQSFKKISHMHVSY